MRSPSPSSVVFAGLLALVVVACGGAPQASSRPGAEAARGGWERVASMPQRRSYIAAAQIGRYVYTAGGMVGDTGRPLATFTRYDTARDEWTALPQLPVPTRAAAAGAVGGVVYVIGGTTAAGNTRAVWAWDGRSWRRRAPMPAARFNHAVAVLGTRIFVLGGYAGGTEHDDVFVYDTRTNEWERGRPLPRPTHAFGAVTLGGELWLLGGRRGEAILRDVWILGRAGRGTWRRGPTMPTSMELLGAAVAGDRIHAVWESVYQVYDVSERRWRQGPRPLVTRHALKVFAAGGALYTVGGCTTALRDSPIVERLAL